MGHILYYIRDNCKTKQRINLGHSEYESSNICLSCDLEFVTANPPEQIAFFTYKKYKLSEVNGKITDLWIFRRNCHACASVTSC